MVREASYSDQDPRTGLIVAPRLGYLPAYGTLMVNVTVRETRREREASVQCAVHYVDDGDRTRYIVKPQQANAVEPLRVQSEMSLPEQAEFEEWPLAHAGTIKSSEETALSVPRLPFHLGGVWTARGAESDEGPPVAKPDKTRAWTDAMDRAEHEKSRFTVEADAIVRGPDGVDAILESGAFWVTGSVFFSPLQPFQPAPDVPHTDNQGNLSGSEDALVAVESIGGKQGYRYPSDHSSGSRWGGDRR